MSQVLDAAYHVVHDYPGGAASLAPRLGKSHGQLCAELNRTGTAKFGLETAVQVTEMSGDMRILEAYAARCGRMTLPLPELLQESDDGILASQGAFLREVADVVQELGKDYADGRITANERDRFRQEVGELTAALQHLLLAVERTYALGVPAGQEVRP